MSRINLSLFICFFVVIGVGYAQDVPDLPQNFDEIVPAVEIAETPDTDWMNEENIIPHSDIYNYLSTAVANVNAMPDDLSMYNGVSLLRDDSATQLLSYAKWLFSQNSANELLGETLAPLGMQMFTVFMVTLIGFIAYITIRVAMFIFKLIKDVVKWILRVLPFVG